MTVVETVKHATSPILPRTKVLEANHTLNRSCLITFTTTRPFLSLQVVYQAVNSS